MTVSRVLRNRGDVSAATREKVLEAARTLGYVPNKIAGALASQRVNLVGVVIPSLSNMVFPEVMTGISEVLDGTGLQPVVGVTNYLPDREEAVIYEMLSWRPSGMIIAGLEHSDAARAMLGRAGPYRSRAMGWPVGAVAGALGLALAGPKRGTYAREPWIDAGTAQATPLDVRRALFLFTIACLLNGALVAGVARLGQQQGWREWLQFAARLPHYSVRNQLLLASQCPHASLVMSAAQWRARM